MLNGWLLISLQLSIANVIKGRVLDVIGDVKVTTPNGGPNKPTRLRRVYLLKNGVMKRSIAQLAVCGGAPAFKEPLHVGRPNVGNAQRFLERAQGILERRWFSNSGPCEQELERELCRFLGVKHCIP